MKKTVSIIALSAIAAVQIQAATTWNVSLWGKKRAFTENVEKLADAGLYSLFVSLDSPDPWEHDCSRGIPGLFETAVEGLKKMKRKGVFVACYWLGFPEREYQSPH